MKLLKLDARFEDARRVARCLVGSRIVDNDLPNHQIGYISGLNNLGVALANDRLKYSSTLTKVSLPLDFLEFCPFVAMREKVQVVGEDSCTLSRDRITQAQILGNSETLVISKWRYAICEISLDLDPIERGELDGCEIVEV